MHEPIDASDPNSKTQSGAEGIDLWTFPSGKQIRNHVQNKQQNNSRSGFTPVSATKSKNWLILSPYQIDLQKSSGSRRVKVWPEKRARLIIVFFGYFIELVLCPLCQCGWWEFLFRLEKKLLPLVSSIGKRVVKVVWDSCHVVLSLKFVVGVLCVYVALQIAWEKGVGWEWFMRVENEVLGWMMRCLVWILI